MIPEPTRWHQPDLIPNTYFAVIFLTLFFIFVTRNLKRVPEGKGQTLLEVFVGGIRDFFGGILGDHGKKYIPFVGSFFIFILFLNILGVIPGLQPPTADLNTTLALGITAVLGVQIIAIKELGIVGYLKHLAGNPPLLGILMFPLEVIAQLSRAGSLAVAAFWQYFWRKIGGHSTDRHGNNNYRIIIFPFQYQFRYRMLFFGFVRWLFTGIRFYNLNIYLYRSVH